MGVDGCDFLGPRGSRSRVASLAADILWELDFEANKWAFPDGVEAWTGRRATARVGNRPIGRVRDCDIEARETCRCVGPALGEGEPLCLTRRERDRRSSVAAIGDTR